MRIRSWPAAAAILACLAAAVPAAGAAQAVETVKVGGTGAALGPLRQLAAAFMARTEGVRVVIEPSMGSTGGIRAVAEGALDIGLSSRRLTEAEAKQDVAAREFARTPFVLAAERHVGSDGMTLADVVRIYRGDLRAWPNGERVRVVLRPRSDTDTAIIRGLSPALAAALDAALKREGMLMGMTDQENAELIERTPGAVGFMSFTQVVTEQPQVKLLAFDGAHPAVKGGANASYPHQKPLYTVTRRSPSPAVSRFMRFLVSEEGARILTAAGCIPAAPHRP